MPDDGYDIEMGRTAFRHGLGAAMAVFLHRVLPGSALAVIGAEDAPGAGFEARRAVVLLADGDRPVWIDVDGIHEGFDLADRVVLRTCASEREMADHFPDGGVSHEGVDAAHRHYASDDDLHAARVRATDILRQAARERERAVTHPEAPPGGGPGWKPLGELAQDAEYRMSDLFADDEEYEAFAARKPEERVRRLYCHSDCDDFAIALNRITGWPFMALQTAKGDSVHRCVQSPDGRLLDASGWSDPEAMRKRYKLRKARVVGPFGEGICFGATVGDAPEGIDDALADAVSAIRQLPWAPFTDPWFRELALRPVDGVDVALPAEDDAPAGPSGP